MDQVNQTGADVVRMTHVDSTSSSNSKATELLRLHTAQISSSSSPCGTSYPPPSSPPRPAAGRSQRRGTRFPATFGYPDGERIPVELMIDMIGPIAAAVDLPVTADLKAGSGDAGETVRKAIGVGVGGANLEDRMAPLADAVAAVAAAVRAGAPAGDPDPELRPATACPAGPVNLL